MTQNSRSATSFPFQDANEHVSAIEFRDGGVSIIRDKITQPQVGKALERPRVARLLAQASERFAANMISGRAGTGKTVAAAAFAAMHRRVAWYRLDAADNAWSIFAAYFAESVRSATGKANVFERPMPSERPEPDEIANFLVRLLPSTYDGEPNEPLLMVLDDVHHIFDAPWFEGFFNFLIYSLPSSAHLLMLCRGKPPQPLWRLRSKQVVNVIDEAHLAFDRDETEALYRELGLSSGCAAEAYEASFGRIGTLLDLVEIENIRPSSDERRANLRTFLENTLLSVT